MWDEKGLLPVSDDMDPYIVDLVVTSIDPSIDVNPAGQAITIFGLGFPASLTEVPTTFSITFSDVSCTLMSTISTEMTCLMGQVPITRRR